MNGYLQLFKEIMKADLKLTIDNNIHQDNDSVRFDFTISGLLDVYDEQDIKALIDTNPVVIAYLSELEQTGLCFGHSFSLVVNRSTGQGVGYIVYNYLYDLTFQLD